MQNKKRTKWLGVTSMTLALVGMSSLASSTPHDPSHAGSQRFDVLAASSSEKSSEKMNSKNNNTMNSNSNSNSNTDQNASNSTDSQSNQLFADALLTAKVKGAFIKEKLFGNMPVEVSGVTVTTNNGMVTLTGTVDSSEKAKNAETIAKSVEGVKGVQSSIAVAPEGSKTQDEGSMNNNSTDENNKKK